MRYADDGAFARLCRTARIFVEMLEGDYQLRALMTNEAVFDRSAPEVHASQAVALFLAWAGRG